MYSPIYQPDATQKVRILSKWGKTQQPMSKRRRTRTLRRAHTREAEKLLRDREKLALLEAGGTAEHPCELESASLVEPRAKSLSCLRCDSGTQIEAHTAEQQAGRLVRVVHLRCSRCGYRRTVFFHVRPVQAN